VSAVPELGYDRIIAALRRDGWVVVSQTLSHILKQARIKLDDFLALI
jgi:hypothetical protein